MDIKPENILLGRDGYFKISDFGLFKALYNKSDANTIREGDSRYMAKELLNDYNYESFWSGKVDITKADIFSLGLTMYKLIVKDRVELKNKGIQW